MGGVAAIRARQLLMLGTELGKSQLAEIGLATTLLDSAAQDRDDIANDSVQFCWSIGQHRITRKCLVLCSHSAGRDAS